MEEKIAQLFPDEIIKIQDYRSFVNQPERIQISSLDDINDYDPATLTSYFNFRVRLPRPALNVKSLQLARANIPICTTNIPDTELVFWYYTLPYVSVGTIRAEDPLNPGNPGDLTYTFDQEGNIYDAVTGVLQNPTQFQVYFEGTGADSNGVLRINSVNYDYDRIDAQAGNVEIPAESGGDVDWFINYTAPVLARPRINYLRYVRLVPSFVQPELLNANTYGFNRTFEDYNDLLTEVQKSCLDDPLLGQVSNSILGSFKFIQDQITFQFVPTFNKFVFTRSTSGLIQTNIWVYCPAASDDPILVEAAAELQERDRQNQGPVGIITGTIELVQPFRQYRYLNQRLGFNYATYPPGVNFNNMCRPIPPYVAPLAPPNLGDFTTYDHVAPGYGDLVYSSCCNIYADIVGGSGIDSMVSKALLGTIPLNAPNLGVGFHSLPLNNPLTKIVNQIYEIYVELRTDTGEPFLLGNNAIVSLEFILTY